MQRRPNRDNETQGLHRNQHIELSGGAAQPRRSYRGSPGRDEEVVADGAGEVCLGLSEAVEAECERGDPDMVKRRQDLLEGVSLFPVNERILRVARLLVVPRALPEKAGTDAVHIAAAAVEECEFLLTLELPPHRKRPDSAGG